MCPHTLHICLHSSLVSSDSSPRAITATPAGPTPGDLASVASLSWLCLRIPPRKLRYHGRDVYDFGLAHVGVLLGPVRGQVPKTLPPARNGLCVHLHQNPNLQRRALKAWRVDTTSPRSHRLGAAKPHHLEFWALLPDTRLLGPWNHTLPSPGGGLHCRGC